MQDKIAELANTLTDAINEPSKKKTKPYDTIATVTRIDENGQAWVNIPGGVRETPVKKTFSVKPGDEVQVRVSGGRAWLQGNYSAPPTDDEKANQAYSVASESLDSAVSAKKAADSAKESAEEASAAATQAKKVTDEIERYAETAEKSVTEILEDAEDAKKAAGEAQTAADNALVSLSTIQDVVGVLNWITAHGTMTNTQDLVPPETVIDPSHVYFVQDDVTPGDYHVGAHYYAIVSEPKQSDIASYYLLTVDESVQNYVATHLAVNTEGLWIVPDAGGNKVLIATGSGSTYTTAGTYIIGKVNNVDKVFAKFATDGVTLKAANGANAMFNYNGVTFKDNSGFGYFNVRDMRNEEGVASITEIMHGPGDTFNLMYEATNTDYTVRVSGGGGGQVTRYKGYFVLETSISVGTEIRVEYQTTSNMTKYFTFGYRDSSKIGSYSSVFGWGSMASGRFSHAEGAQTIAQGEASHAEGIGDSDALSAVGRASHAEGIETAAIGNYSHAEGERSVARGEGAHAQNIHTQADYMGQTAIGMFNENKSTNIFEVGNGTNGARSNAFEVAKTGDVTAGGNITDGGGNILADKITAAEDNASSISISNDVIFTASKTGWLVCTLTTNSGQSIAPYAALEAYKADGSPIGIVSSGWGIATNGANLTVQGPVKSGGKYRVHGVRCSILSTRIFG